MPRLFTGIEIPTHIADGLAALRGGLPGARWVDPENYHLTLRFIGDVDDPVAHEVGAVLGRVRRPSFELHFERVDQFGGRKPRAVFAAASVHPALVELQAEHERLLQRIGLPPESRKFTPHVTLARLRDASTRAVADYLATRGFYRSPSFSVTRFVLFSSRAMTGGGPYVVEASYPLD
jgi:2'-5' RNA ligase